VFDNKVKNVLTLDIMYDSLLVAWSGKLVSSCPATVLN
jgi:hypothetical protein